MEEPLPCHVFLKGLDWSWPLRLGGLNEDLHDHGYNEQDHAHYKYAFPWREQRGPLEEFDNSVGQQTRPADNQLLGKR